MRKIKNPKIGEYVLVTKFADKDPKDPWYVSFISEKIIMNERIYYKVQGINRLWKNCFRITEQEGIDWLNKYSGEEYK